MESISLKINHANSDYSISLATSTLHLSLTNLSYTVEIRNGIAGKRSQGRDPRVIKQMEQHHSAAERKRSRSDRDGAQEEVIERA